MWSEGLAMEKGLWLIQCCRCGFWNGVICRFCEGRSNQVHFLKYRRTSSSRQGFPGWPGASLSQQISADTGLGSWYPGKWVIQERSLWRNFPQSGWEDLWAAARARLTTTRLIEAPVAGGCLHGESPSSCFSDVEKSADHRQSPRYQSHEDQGPPSPNRSWRVGLTGARRSWPHLAFSSGKYKKTISNKMEKKKSIKNN